MAWPEVLMWLVVVGIGFPAATSNRTALALTISWLVAQGMWLVTEESLPIPLYIICDYAVLLVIFSKPKKVDCSPCETLLDQFKALWIEQSLADRYVSIIFLLMWITYLAPVSAYYCWWTLWVLAIAQFFVAGWEAFTVWLFRYRSTLIGGGGLWRAVV